MRIRTVVSALTVALTLIGSSACTHDRSAELVADIEDYPGLGSLEISSGDDRWSHWCGVTLVAATVGITAAHCVTPSTPVGPITSRDVFRARFASSVREAGGIVRHVGEVRSHPSFVYREVGNVDAALVIFTEAVPIAPTTLLPPDASAPIALVGWGGIESDGAFSPKLKRLDAAILPAEACPDGAIQAWEICVSTSGEIDTTGGDSGGPGSQRLPGDGRWGTVGILSRWAGSRHGEVPDIYTSVYELREWIAAEVAATEIGPDGQHPSPAA